MKKLSYYKAFEIPTKFIYGGTDRKEEKNTRKQEERYSDASETCPCGDHSFEITFDGPWAKENMDYCTQWKCTECMA